MFNFPRKLSHHLKLMAWNNHHFLIQKYIADRDEVVLSKIGLSNFRPKQANEWIGDPRGSIMMF
jgi:hypothetical protein